MWWRVWAAITASAPPSCSPARAGVARASPRTRTPWCTWANVSVAIWPWLNHDTVQRPATQRVVDKVVAALDSDVSGTRIALWGLTFKAGTDDLRDSPSLEIAQRLIALGASVQGFDPTVSTGTLYGVEVHSSSLSAAKGADALVIGTESPEFAAADFTALAAVMVGRVIVNTRNLFDPLIASGEGFTYSGIGTPPPGQPPGPDVVGDLGGRPASELDRVLPRLACGDYTANEPVSRTC